MFFFYDDETEANEVSNYSEATFESIKHINEYGQEFWYARELQEALEYAEWRNFYKVICKAMESCENAEIGTYEHFVEVNKTSVMPNGGERVIEDYELSRYACYPGTVAAGGNGAYGNNHYESEGYI
ncbi:MAG: hypothetical protein IJ058_13460 [Lachnospiraceae bacterium]|nr:hypothetical protein [Lachnospiraceae bacterium]